MFRVTQIRRALNAMVTTNAPTKPPKPAAAPGDAPSAAATAASNGVDTAVEYAASGGEAVAEAAGGEASAREGGEKEEEGKALVVAEEQEEDAMETDEVTRARLTAANHRVLAPVEHLDVVEQRELQRELERVQAEQCRLAASSQSPQPPPLPAAAAPPATAAAAVSAPISSDKLPALDLYRALSAMSECRDGGAGPGGEYASTYRRDSTRDLCRALCRDSTRALCRAFCGDSTRDLCRAAICGLHEPCLILTRLGATALSADGPRHVPARHATTVVERLRASRNRRLIQPEALPQPPCSLGTQVPTVALCRIQPHQPRHQPPSAPHRCLTPESGIPRRQTSAQLTMLADEYMKPAATSSGSTQLDSAQLASLLADDTALDELAGGDQQTLFAGAIADDGS